MNISAYYYNRYSSVTSQGASKVGCHDYNSMFGAQKLAQQASASKGTGSSDRKYHMSLNATLGAGGSGNGSSYALNYASNSTDENPVVIADWIDPDGNKFKQTFNLNDIDPTNATYVEMAALGAHLGAPGLGPLAATSGGEHKYGEKKNYISDFKKAINMANSLGDYASSQRAYNKLSYYMDFMATQNLTKSA